VRCGENYGEKQTVNFCERGTACHIRNIKRAISICVWYGKNQCYTPPKNDQHWIVRPNISSFMPFVHYKCRHSLLFFLPWKQNNRVYFFVSVLLSACIIMALCAPGSVPKTEYFEITHLW